MRGPAPRARSERTQARTAPCVGLVFNDLGSYRRVAVTPTIARALGSIVLPQVGGEPVRLGALWETAPAILVFLRHYG